MRNWSIRNRILAGVILVNLVGAVLVAVYLHQTFSGGLGVAAREDLKLTRGAWEDISSHTGKPVDFATLVAGGSDLMARMKKVTGSDYGLLIDKTAGDQATYAKARAAANLPDNWSEGDTYVVAAVTNDAFSSRMALKTAPGDIPQIGKLVGIENGACASTCHEGVKGSGEFWGVGWSRDNKTRAFAVLPIADASGKAIGLVYSIQDLSVAADTDRSSLYQTLIVIFAGLLAATGLIAIMLNSLVFKRLTKMITTMEDLSLRVAGGDFSAVYETDGSNDEIGHFEQFFAKLLNLMSQTLKSVVEK
jgi:methyl-accepting chemotaxis protein